MSKIFAWIEDRFALGPIRKSLLERKVPKSPWYFSDGSTLLLLFGILVGTGCFLALSYSPTPETAYQSVKHITERQPMGWFVRGLHYWGAGLMMVMVWFHLFRVISVGGYKAPREGTWLFGVLLLFCVFMMGFIGYLLRWDERGMYALTLCLHMFQKVPFIGEWLVRLVQGGEELGPLTLSRLYAVHTLFLPFAMVALVGGHLYLVIQKGITTKTEREKPVHSKEEQEEIYQKEKEEGEDFHPETTARNAVIGFIVFLVLLGLTLFYGEIPMYPEANMVEPSMPTGEWWWWWYSGIIGLTGHPVVSWFLVLFPPTLFLALVCLPFLDRNPHRNIKKRPFIATALVLSLLTLLAATFARWNSPWTGWPTEELPSIPAELSLTEEGERGRKVFSRYGCTSCHAIAGSGPEVGPDLAGIGVEKTEDEIRQAIISPPQDSSMPLDYQERMTTEELQVLLKFLSELTEPSRS